jgi:hypothetical protein
MAKYVKLFFSRQEQNRMFNLPQQPLGFFGTLKYSILLWWKKLFTLLPLSIVASITSSWPLYLKELVMPDAHPAIFIVIAITLTIISLIPYLGIFAKFSREIKGETLTLSQCFAAGLLKLPSGLLLLIIIIVLLGSPFALGMFFFMKLGQLWLMLILFMLFFILSVYLNCSFPLLVIDNLSPSQAIKHSFQLVKHHWWYVAGIMFIISLFTISVENIGRTIYQNNGFIIANCFMLSLQIAASVIILQQLRLLMPKAT